jgi:hypothetical protein
MHSINHYLQLFVLINWELKLIIGPESNHTQVFNQHKY